MSFDNRSPEDIPPAMLANADQLQAASATAAPGIAALMAAAEAEARELAAAGERPLTIDEQTALVQAQLALEDVTGPDDIGV